MNHSQFLLDCRLHVLYDTSKILNDKNTEPLLLFKLGCLLFNQGLTNSNKQTGIFADQYLRDGFIPDPEQSLLYTVIEGISQKNWFSIPLSDEKTAYDLLTHIKVGEFTTTEFTLSTVDIKFKKITCLDFKSDKAPHSIEQLCRLTRVIGNHGALATKDTLLWLLLSKSDVKSIIQKKS